VKARIVTVLAVALAASVGSSLSRAQQRNAKPTTTPFRHKVFYYHPFKEPMTPEALDLVKSQAAALKPSRYGPTRPSLRTEKPTPGRWLDGARLLTGIASRRFPPILFR
jgi:hypothetical protein